MTMGCPEHGPHNPVGVIPHERAHGDHGDLRLERLSVRDALLAPPCPPRPRGPEPRADRPPAPLLDDRTVRDAAPCRSVDRTPWQPAGRAARRAWLLARARSRGACAVRSRARTGIRADRDGERD